MTPVKALLMSFSFHFDSGGVSLRGVRAIYLQRSLTNERTFENKSSFHWWVRLRPTKCARVCAPFWSSPNTSQHNACARLLQHTIPTSRFCTNLIAIRLVRPLHSSPPPHHSWWNNRCADNGARALNSNVVIEYLNVPWQHLTQRGIQKVGVVSSQIETKSLGKEVDKRKLNTGNRSNVFIIVFRGFKLRPKPNYW